MLPRSMRNQAAKARALDELRESNEFLNIAKDVAAQRAQDLVKVRRDSMIEANAAEAVGEMDRRGGRTRRRTDTFDNLNRVQVMLHPNFHRKLFCITLHLHQCRSP